MADPAQGGRAALGQWVHQGILGASLPASQQLTLGEGLTPLEPAPELGAELGVPELRLKREDRNPTGSHKARCLALLCSQLLAEGRRQAVISSSGNAAVAAAAYCDLGGIHLLSLVSPQTPEVKLRRLLTHDQLTVASRRPVALLHHAVRSWGLADLRGSQHPLSPNAYRGIAAELVEEGPLGAVFLFASSGASALGLAQGLELLLAPQERPQLHVVEALPGGELTRPWYPGEAEPAADGPQVGELGARRSRLAPAVRRAVRSLGGRGWRVPPRELPALRELAQRHGVRTSWEGLATLWAMRQAARQGQVTGSGSWVAILTGDEAQLDLAPAARLAIPSADDEAELDRLLGAQGFVSESR